MSAPPIPFAAIYRAFNASEAADVARAIATIAAEGRIITALRVRDWLEIERDELAAESEREAYQAAVCEQAQAAARQMVSTTDWRAQEWAERLRREQREAEAARQTGERARRIAAMYAARLAEAASVAA